MMWALLHKDTRLLRTHLRSFVITSILCYVSAGAVTLANLEKTENIWEESTAIIAATLAGGSFLSICATSVFAALLSGSTITLERSDRSSQFLAYLPPTRLQIFFSKMVVVLSAVTISICILLVTWFLANRLLNWQLLATEGNSISITSVEADTSLEDSLFLWFALIWDDVSLHPLLAAMTSVVGCSLLISVGSRSNAVPTIFGILIPIVIFFIFVNVVINWFPDLAGATTTVAFSLMNTFIGLGCAIAAGCWFCIQKEH